MSGSLAEVLHASSSWPGDFVEKNLKSIHSDYPQLALFWDSGAETGTGGRIRDTHATGTGSIMGIGTAGYCVGNLQLEGYQQVPADAASR